MISTLPRFSPIGPPRFLAGGGGGIALIAEDIRNGGVSASLNTTGANFAVVAAINFSALGTITDSQSNTWIPLTAQSSSNAYIRLFYCIGLSASSSHTFFNSGSFQSIGVLVFSGVNASPFDSENGASSGGASSIQPGSVTPSTDGCVIVTGLNNYTASAATIDSGFTGFSVVISSGLSGGIAYLIQPTASPVNPTWSYTSPDVEAAVIAVFKPA